MRKYLLLLLLFPLMSSAQVDLSIDSIFHRSGAGGYFDKGLEYYSIPEYQYTEIEFSAIISNLGSSNATNAFLKVEVFKDGLIDTTLYSDSSDICTTCQDSLAADCYQISSQSTYLFKYTITSDSVDVLTNNMDSVLVIGSFQNSNYRRENGLQVDTVSNRIGNVGNPFSTGPLFEFFEDDKILSVNIGVDTSTSNIGQLIYGIIYKFNPLDSSWVFQGQTYDHPIQSNELGTEVELFLDDCVFPLQGDIFAVLGAHYGGSDGVVFKVSEYVKSSSVLYITPFDMYTDSLNTTVGCPIVFPRMGSNSECFGSIKEANQFPNFSIYPNPAANQIQLVYELAASQNTEILIFDLQGKQLNRFTFKNQQVGTQNLNLDISNLPSGVYFVKLNVGVNIISHRLIIQD